MERAFLDWLAERLPPHPRLLLGPGDDAGIVHLTGRAKCIVSVDMLMDGVDFLLAEIDPRRAGRKALAVNLSDMAAMAARPLAAVIALALPRQGSLDLAMRLYEGLLPLAEQYDLAIAGGDTNVWNGPLAISVTVLGEVTSRGPLRRDGAKPGDRILVTGQFGGSILAHHLDFEPRVREALLLHERYELHAGMDVSDGLALDLSRLARASGCGALLRTCEIPLSSAAHTLSQARGGHGSPVQHALGDGEDFELLLTLPATEARRLLRDQPLAIRLTEIGEMIPEPGLWQQDPAGNRQPLAATGFEH